MDGLGDSVADHHTCTIKQLCLYLALHCLYLLPWPNERVQPGIISGRTYPGLATEPQAHPVLNALGSGQLLLSVQCCGLSPECRLRTKDSCLCYGGGRKGPLAKMTAELPPMPQDITRGYKFLQVL